MQKLSAAVTSLSALIIAAALAALAYLTWQAHALPALSTPYHAVALTNNQVFFGRIEALGGDYLVLREVYYIRAREDPETKQVANILIRRGAEWHAPDRMIVGREQVRLIEPVTANSQVARLIAEQQRQAR